MLIGTHNCVKKTTIFIAHLLLNYIYNEFHTGLFHFPVKRTWVYRKQWYINFKPIDNAANFTWQNFSFATVI
jgi:hypothetical protein